MNEFHSKGPPFRKKKRQFYGNQFTKLKKLENIVGVRNRPKSCTKVQPVNEIKPSLDIYLEDNLGSFNWRPYLRKPSFSAAPVSCFKHVALSNCWDSIVLNVKVEVRSPDCKTCCTTSAPCCYWLATVIKVCGYWGLLRYEGCDRTSPAYFNISDKWINLCTEPHIHPVGWCAKNGEMLVPPKCLEPKIICWKAFLMDMLPGSKTIPPDFSFRIEEHIHNSIRKGMRLEVVDKNLISVVRSAVVTDVVGGRLHIKYAENEGEDEGFWCHERSPLIHPVGWAQIIGHALKAHPKYARKSLKKTLYRTFGPKDATWDMFLPVYNPVTSLKFKRGMKLEAIDPLNLSTVCVATVTEVLRNNYLMIGIDGMMAPNGADCFCYHASSPCIFPVGFCDTNAITLTPPRGFKEEFRWSDYLKKTKAEAAPVDLFRKDLPNHGFEKGMYLEAVDLMEPRLICVAYVTKVVGRLLKIHFDGWEDDYDQWCDCQSPDLFPIGWCDVLGYRLEAPRLDVAEEYKKKKKVIVKKRKRRHWSKRPTSSEDSPVAEEKTKQDPLGPSQDKSVITLDDSSSNSFYGKKKNLSKRKSGFIPNSELKKQKISPIKKEPDINACESIPKTTPGKKQLRSQRVVYLEQEESEPGRRRKRKHRACVKKTPAYISEDEEFSSSSCDDPEFSATRKTVSKHSKKFRIGKKSLMLKRAKISGSPKLSKQKNSKIVRKTRVIKNEVSSTSDDDSASSFDVSSFVRNEWKELKHSSGEDS